jgi:hypothetical protein
MAFRLIVAEAPDLTTIRVVGHLRDDGVLLLGEACAAGRRPLVLDLSELTGASDSGVLLLDRLSREGVHLLAASPYVRLLLAQAHDPSDSPLPRLRRVSRPVNRRRVLGRAHLRHRP